MTSAAAGAVRKFRIADIVVSDDRKRSVKGTEELTTSIRELGLLNPIILSKEGRLIAGLHRLRACEALGWKEIPAIVLSLSELDAELAEIDENLCRTELTVLEHAEQTARRKELYQARHPQSRQGVAGAAASNRKQGKGDAPAIMAVASFVDDTSTKTGKPKRSIERAVQIAQGIAPEVRDAIRDSPLADRVLDLVSLAQLADPDVQAEVADQVMRGRAKSVAAALKQRHPEEAEGSEEVVRDQLGQEITDPEIAEAFVLITHLGQEVVGHLRAGARAWGTDFHEKQVAARRLRVVESRAYVGIRHLAENELPQLASLLAGRAPYALCPYCKGAPLPKDRKKYCQGCGGGGWVDRGVYDSAPPELQVRAEVGHE